MYRDRIYARFTTKATSLSWTRHGGTIGRSRAGHTPGGRGLEPRAHSTVAASCNFTIINPKKTTGVCCPDGCGGHHSGEEDALAAM